MTFVQLLSPLSDLWLGRSEDKDLTRIQFQPSCPESQLSLLLVTETSSQWDIWDRGPSSCLTSSHTSTAGWRGRRMTRGRPGWPRCLDRRPGPGHSGGRRQGGRSLAGTLRGWSRRPTEGCGRPRHCPLQQTPGHLPHPHILHLEWGTRAAGPSGSSCTSCTTWTSGPCTQTGTRTFWETARTLTCQSIMSDLLIHLSRLTVSVHGWGGPRV